MYEPSRVLLSFHIAGFQYADGALVLGDLKVGDKLTLCAERDNPHDPEAVAIYYGNTKLGYVPGNGTVKILSQIDRGGLGPALL